MIYIPSSIIPLIYIFIKYIVVYKKIDKHTKVRREKIMLEKQKKYQNLYHYRKWKKIWKDKKKKKKRTTEQRIN